MSLAKHIFVEGSLTPTQAAKQELKLLSAAANNRGRGFALGFYSDREDLLGMVREACVKEPSADITILYREDNKDKYDQVSPTVKGSFPLSNIRNIYVAFEGPRGTWEVGHGETAVTILLEKSEGEQELAHAVVVLVTCIALCQDSEATSLFGWLVRNTPVTISYVEWFSRGSHDAAAVTKQLLEEFVAQQERHQPAQFQLISTRALEQPGRPPFEVTLPAVRLADLTELEALLTGDSSIARQDRLISDFTGEAVANLATQIESLASENAVLSYSEKMLSQSASQSCSQVEADQGTITGALKRGDLRSGQLIDLADKISNEIRTNTSTANYLSKTDQELRDDINKKLKPRIREYSGVVLRLRHLRDGRIKRLLGSGLAVAAVAVGFAFVWMGWQKGLLYTALGGLLTGGVGAEVFFFYESRRLRRLLEHFVKTFRGFCQKVLELERDRLSEDLWKMLTRQTAYRTLVPLSDLLHGESVRCQYLIDAVTKFAQTSPEVACLQDDRRQHVQQVKGKATLPDLSRLKDECLRYLTESCFEEFDSSNFYQGLSVLIEKARLWSTGKLRLAIAIAIDLSDKSIASTLVQTNLSKLSFWHGSEPSAGGEPEAYSLFAHPTGNAFDSSSLGMSVRDMEHVYPDCLLMVSFFEVARSSARRGEV